MKFFSLILLIFPTLLFAQEDDALQSFLKFDLDNSSTTFKIRIWQEYDSVLGKNSVLEIVEQADGTCEYSYHVCDIPNKSLDKGLLLHWQKLKKKLLHLKIDSLPDFHSIPDAISIKQLSVVIKVEIFGEKYYSYSYQDLDEPFAKKTAEKEQMKKIIRLINKEFRTRFKVSDK